MKLSVLMSIYHKEKDIYFNRAMKSIWDEQTVKPNEIVLVQDGPLTQELYGAIDSWKIKLKDILVVVNLDSNLGLGEALNAGIKKCSNELVARMDTDDISTSDRFEKQLKIFENKNVDVCSAWIAEFENDENKITSYRKTPEFHNDIAKYGRTRSPINHIPVMFKKSSVLSAGGYKHMLWMEDYYLWTRMIINGAKLYNIQESLAKIRAGESQLSRRGGIKYLFSEIKLQKKLYKLKYIGLFKFLINIFTRSIVRLMPKKILQIVYKFLRK
jgi:glycosyltransferase involved in cell wall biosynthesis